MTFSEEGPADRISSDDGFDGTQESQNADDNGDDDDNDSCSHDDSDDSAAKNEDGQEAETIEQMQHDADQSHSHADLVCVESDFTPDDIETHALEFLSRHEYAIASIARAPLKSVASTSGHVSAMSNGKGKKRAASLPPSPERMSSRSHRLPFSNIVSDPVCGPAQQSCW